MQCCGETWVVCGISKSKVLLKTFKEWSQVKSRKKEIQWNPSLGTIGNIEELKQSRPLVHNHVPALICNGMIGPVLV